MSLRTALLISLASLGLAVSAARSARADVPAPRPSSGPQPCPASTEAACAGKRAGDACVTSGAAGTCQALRCTNDAGETLLACSVTPPPTPTPSTAPTGSSAPTTTDGGCTSSPVRRAEGSTFGVVAGLVALGLGAGRRRRAAA